MAQSSPAGNPGLPRLPKWPIVRSVLLNGAEEPVSGGPVVTFTLQVPFPLGFKDDSVCIVQPFASWADSGAASVFGEKPYVVLRFGNVPIADYDPYPQRGAEALQKHYGFTFGEEESMGDDHSPDDAAYEQWVSMETPNVRLDNEEPLDEAFAFHRCLQVFSDLLRAHHMVYHDHRVRPVTTYDVGAVVFMGGSYSASVSGLDVMAAGVVMSCDWFESGRYPGMSVEQVAESVELADSPFGGGREV